MAQNVVVLTPKANLEYKDVDNLQIQDGCLILSWDSGKQVGFNNSSWERYVVEEPKGE